MAAPFTISADVSEKTLQEFSAAFTKYKTVLGNNNAVAVRRGTIALLKSLRSRTRTAPEVVDRKDVILPKSDPRYVSTEDGKELRRIQIMRWKDGRAIYREYWMPARFKYRTRMGMKNGNYQGIVSRSDDKTKLVKAARMKYGHIRLHGLARMSWGWFMAWLFNQSAKVENKRVKITANMVEGYFRKDGKGKNTEAKAVIWNKLRYIRDSLKPGALEEAMRAATNSINAQIEKGLAKARKELD